MRAAIFAFTKNGVVLAVQLLDLLKIQQFEATLYTIKDYAVNIAACKVIGTSLKAEAQVAFDQCRLIVFVGSLGIAVRTIAPLIQDKTTDPAVLCIDEAGKYVIPVLSGHIGRANDFAKQIAKQLHASAVITTATDVNGLFSVDEWAAKQGLYIRNIKQAKSVAKSLLDGEAVGLHTEFCVSGELPRGLVRDENCKTGIAISLHEEHKPFESTLNLLPKIVHLGIGCRRDTSLDVIEEGICKVLAEEQISIHSICAMASIDLKKDEPGLLQFARKRQLPIFFYTAAELESIDGEFSKSEFVKSVTTVDNVCERAAVLSADGGRLILKKTIRNGVTIALAVADWSVTFEN